MMSGHRLAGSGRAVAGGHRHHARRRCGEQPRLRTVFTSSSTAAGVDTLYDDRDERGGAKLASMDLIGVPWQLIVGPRGIAAGTVELKKRGTGEKQDLSVESALARFAE